MKWFELSFMLFFYFKVLVKVYRKPKSVFNKSSYLKSIKKINKENPATFVKHENFCVFYSIEKIQLIWLLHLFGSGIYQFLIFFLSFIFGNVKNVKYFCIHIMPKWCSVVTFIRGWMSGHSPIILYVIHCHSIIIYGMYFVYGQ